MKNALIILLTIITTTLSAQVYTNTFSPEFLVEVSKGNVPGHSMIHKFGAGTVGTTIGPITQSGEYKTPTTATTLEFVSSDVDDNATGDGARKIQISGLYGTSYRDTTIEISTNGTTAVAIPVDFYRIYRWRVSESGTYATQSAGSHQGTLTIRESGAGATWSTIGISPFPFGQSQIGAYTIPKGKTGYLLSKNVFVDGVKNADVYFFQRTDIDDVDGAYSGTMRIVERQTGVSGGVEITTKSPKGKFIGPCDVGFMAVIGTGSADVSVEFELLLVDN